MHLNCFLCAAFVLCADMWGEEGEVCRSKRPFYTFLPGDFIFKQLFGLSLFKIALNGILESKGPSFTQEKLTMHLNCFCVQHLCCVLIWGEEGVKCVAARDLCPHWKEWSRLEASKASGARRLSKISFRKYQQYPLGNTLSEISSQKIF